jgi:hypothetical protein
MLVIDRIQAQSDLPTNHRSAALTRGGALCIATGVPSWT